MPGIAASSGAANRYRMKASCSGDQADWTQRVRRIGGGGMQSSRRSEERRVGKSVSVRVDLGGRRIIKKKHHSSSRASISSTTPIYTSYTSNTSSTFV